MFKKKQVLTMVGIAISSFVIGNMFNVMASDSGGNPWDKVWTAISGLESRVETLEGQLPQQGFLTAPAYDSGWVSVKDKYYQLNAFEHGLGTTDVLVYAYRNVSDEAGVSQNFGFWISQWCNLTDNTIWVWFTYPGGEQPLYDDVRVMIWKISEP